MREDDESIGGCTAFGWGGIVSRIALALALILALLLMAQ